MRQVTRTERGWAGHFICANDCRFRRNTLLECGHERIVVSTVGNMFNKTMDEVSGGEGKIQEIGYNRYFETMAFFAECDSPYWEANVTREIEFRAPRSIAECEHGSDGKANDMHEAVAAELTERLEQGELFGRIRSGERRQGNDRRTRKG